MEHLELVLALIFVVAITGILSKLTRFSLPLIQVFIGVILSQLPGFRNINLDPPFFFLLFIPPLLFSDSWLIPKREFFKYKWPILRLSIILVFLNTLAIGYLTHWLFPGVSLAEGFVLGAAISPTDAVATLSIMQKYKIPTSITSILNGESLVNDASGLVAFKFAIAAVLTGTFSLLNATWAFMLLVLGGIGVGLVVAWIISELRAIIAKRKLAEPFVQVTLSLLTPFAAYLVADNIHVSGILAVVTAGIYAGMNDAKYMSRDTRMHATEVWSLLLYLLNGTVFLLLGHALPKVISDLQMTGWHLLFAKALLITLCMLVFRLICVFLSTYIPHWTTSQFKKKKNPSTPSLKNIFIIGWTGIRGAITLAATLSIPLTLADGTIFPNRELLIFLASAVIIITLLLQSASIPVLIKWLNLKDDGIAEKEEHFARIKVLTAATIALESRLKLSTAVEEQNQIVKIIERYNQRLLDISLNTETSTSAVKKTKLEQMLRMVALKAERAELLHLRNIKAINENVMRLIERELDYEEAFVRTFKTY